MLKEEHEQVAEVLSGLLAVICMFLLAHYLTLMVNLFINVLGIA